MWTYILKVGPGFGECMRGETRVWIKMLRWQRV